MKDAIVQKVIEKFQQRSELGFKKYGTTLERDDLIFEQWLTHLQEELMDAVNYIEKLKDHNTDTLQLNVDKFDRNDIAKLKEIFSRSSYIIQYTNY